MKRTVKVVVPVLLVIAVVLFLTGCPQAKQPQRPGSEEGVEKSRQQAEEAVDDRTLIQVAQADPFKRCEDCHKGTIEVQGKTKDITLAGEVKAIETRSGRPHPDVPRDITVTGCITCHESLNLRAELAEGVHRAHGNSEVFHPKYKGDCMTCHSMQTDGKIVLKGMAEQGASR